jgi:hypothetical protein
MSGSHLCLSSSKPANLTHSIFSSHSTMLEEKKHSQSSTLFVCCGKYLGGNLGQKKNKKLNITNQV